LAINGGPLLEAYLIGYERMLPSRAVGTAVAIVARVSAVGALAHVAGGDVSVNLVLHLAPGAVLGGYLGAWLAPRVNTRVLAPVLGLLTLGTMVPLLLR
jgi:uncharacterized membrane protein YfcA